MGDRAKLHGRRCSSTPERFTALHHRHRLRLTILYLAHTLAKKLRRQATAVAEVEPLVPHGQADLAHLRLSWAAPRVRSGP